MARQDTNPAGHALQSDPHSPGNRICQHSQQACLEAAIHFTSYSIFLEYPGHILHRLPPERKVPATIERWHFFQLNPML